MAFVLTPIYQQPQFSPFGFAAPRQVHRYRGCPGSRRVQISPFNHFFSQVDELLGEIDRQAQRQAHCEALRKAHKERQERKRALRAQFAVKQVEEGWQVDGEFQGFDQENISIEVTNDYTLKIAGNTEWQAEAKQDAPVQSATAETADLTEENVAAAESATPTVAAESDVASEKSHQATVEDDFEDLGAETASMRSASSESTSVSEPKGKEKAVEEPTAQEPTAEQTQEQEPEGEKPQGSFEKTFQFPERIDAANVRASFKDGALTITVPRAPVQEAKRITIA